MKLAEEVRRTPDVLDPSWQRWLDLVELAVAESQRPVWSAGVRIRDGRRPEAPLLHESTLRVDATCAADFVGRAAGQFGIAALERIDPLALILGGIERDTGTFVVLAGRLAVPPETVAVLAQLSALPLLLNAAKTLDGEAARMWQRGYCPVCGAWPAVVEMRGIQRERRMRCGCCGSDWLLPVLRCAFCDEGDHRKLGFLAEEDDPHVRVETCSTCRGYLKVLSTLSTLPFTSLASKDMATLSFDLIARDRGYSRPARPAWPLQVEIVQ